MKIVLPARQFKTSLLKVFSASEFRSHTSRGPEMKCSFFHASRAINSVHMIPNPILLLLQILHRIYRLVHRATENFIWKGPPKIIQTTLLRAQSAFKLHITSVHQAAQGFSSQGLNISGVRDSPVFLECLLLKTGYSAKF